MKTNRLYFISLCAIAGLSLYACDGDSGKSCDKTADCGDSSEWKCDLDTSTCMRLFPEHCANGKTDAGETDQDCGGTCVTDSKKKITCGLNKVCGQNSDCGSGKCENKKCVTVSCNDLGGCDDKSLTCDRATMTCISCSDNAKNGDETDIDCGGTKCEPCAGGKACKENSDCELGLCENGKCSSTESVEAKSADLLINEFMAAEDGTKDETKAKHFPYNGNASQCKFVEIVNVSKNRVNVDKCQLLVIRQNENGDPDLDKVSTTQLEGNILSKGVILALSNSCKDFPMAPGTKTVTLGNVSNITKTAAYFLQIDCEADGEAGGDPVDVPVATTGFSMNRPEDMKLLGSDDDKEMIKHTDAKGAFDFAYASPSYCTNGGLFSQDCKTTCGDGAINSDETDLDCGGNFCTPCATGKKCSVNSDCDSKNCASGICAAAKCTEDKDCEGELKCNTTDGVCEGCGDGILNRDETDIDCGGSCSAKCELNQKCSVATDCTTGECTDGKCSGEVPDVADVDVLVINEVMGSPKGNFTLDDQKTTAQCEFVEIINTSNKKLSLSGLKLNLKKIDDGSITSVDLDNIIISENSAAVVGGCETLPLPADVAYKQVFTNSNTITNSKAYELWISSDTKEGAHITRAAKDANGQSQARNPDITGTELEFGDATPGYCRNGALFSQNCALDCHNGSESCGGICKEKCGAGKHCESADDCLSGECTANVCANFIDPSLLIINEIFDSASGSPAFSETNGRANACEFIEIANPTDKEVNVKGVKIELAGTNSTGKTSTIDLTPAGSIPAKNLLVVNNCETSCEGPEECHLFTVPADAKSLKVDVKAIFTGTWTYDISILAGEDKRSTQIKDLTIGSESKSSYNRDPDFAANGESPASMIKTTSKAGEYAHYATPGYCRNGKSFSSGCVDDPVAE